MKVAVIDTSHWHAPLAAAGLARAPCEVVAVSGPDDTATGPWASQFGSRVYATANELLDNEQPDFVFVFGSHRQLPVVAKAVISRGIACSVEKPGGTCAADVAALNELRRSKGGFVSVPFVNRLNPVFRALKDRNCDEFTHVALVDIAGSLDRYPAAGCDWMLDLNEAGGGCLINLGVHFIDLFAHLSGGPVRFAGAALSNANQKKAVEDHARVLLMNDRGATGFLEVGYTFPDDEGRHQLFTFVGPGWLADARGETCRIVRSSGAETFGVSLDAGPFYADYVLATLRAAERGEAPVAGLDDLHAVMGIVDAAYAAARPRAG